MIVRVAILLVLALVAVLIVRVTGEAPPAPVRPDFADTEAAIPGTGSDPAAFGERVALSEGGRARAAEDFVVEVVDANTGAPVAAAEVVYLTESGLEHWLSAEEPEFSEPVLREFGTVVRSDARGRATCAGQHGWLPVYAVAPGRIGRLDERDFPRPGEIARIALIPRIELAVTVLDLDGTGAPGIDVLARWHAARSGVPRWNVIGQTDEAGQFVLSDAQFALREWLTHPTDMQLGLPPDFAVPEQDLPVPVGGRVAMTFRLPPCGEVAVELVDEDGVLTRCPAAHLGLQVAGREPAAFYGSRLTWHRVRVGAPLRLFGSLLNDAVDQAVPAPQYPGDRVLVRVRAEPVEARVTGRVVDDRGQPRDDVELTMHLDGGPVRTDTDETGEFEFVVYVQATSQQRARLHGRQRRASDAVAIDFGDFGVLVAGTADLGDLVMR